MMGSKEREIYHPGLLSEEDCWSILCRMALSERNEMKYKEVGMKIIKKCNGLPLAIKTLGSLLRFKKNLQEWEGVLNSEIWEMKEAEVDLFPHLLLTYNELSSTHKRCFSYCAVFPKDSKIVIESLIGDWMALGYLGSDKCEMELEGRECFDVLAMRSLFQDFEKDDMDEVKSCKMHDIVHDFAQFLRNNNRVEATEMNKATCAVCDPSFVSKVNGFWSLECGGDKYPSNFCNCLLRLRVLSLTAQRFPQETIKLIHLRSLKLFSIDKLSCEDLKIIFQLYNLKTLILWGCNVEEIPREIKNLIYLRHLELSKNDSLEELPTEIGKLISLRCLKMVKNKSLKSLPSVTKNLINLKHLQLSDNSSLGELPKEIGNLIHLRELNLNGCTFLKELPESIHSFRELQVLDVVDCQSLSRLPQGFGQLTNLSSLVGEFKGGSGWSKLGVLKKLNNLGGELQLRIRLEGDDIDLEDIVKDVREAELKKKTHLLTMCIKFEDYCSNNSVRMEVLDAVEPHSNLQYLNIWNYKGLKVPTGWIDSSLNQLKALHLEDFQHLRSLPPVGRLPCLEALLFSWMPSLQFVGRELLGGSSNLQMVSFPRLKKLIFKSCPEWKEWEDITAEEAAAALSIMPCLTTLEIIGCNALSVLPHHLLGKASLLEKIRIRNSPVLAESYRDKEGLHWKSISLNNPNLYLELIKGHILIG